jgi:FMN phosphatase YigB (HAD superfamily)
MAWNVPPRSRVVWLFDVDNTLLDNDRVERDLADHLEQVFGADCRDRYFTIFERLRHQLGYADYLGALQRYREEHARNPEVLALSFFLIEYPFADRLYDRALETVEHVRPHGTPVILSDGDVVFQPWKIKRSGLWQAFHQRALVYIHKERMLDDVERHYPADHYVFIDDKLRLLTAVKRIWGERVTTVFPRQGHYALDPAVGRAYPPADVTLEAIGDLLGQDPAALLPRGHPSTTEVQ